MPGPRPQRWQCRGRAQGMAAPLAPWRGCCTRAILGLTSCVSVHPQPRCSDCHHQQRSLCLRGPCVSCPCGCRQGPAGSCCSALERGKRRPFAAPWPLCCASASREGSLCPGPRRGLVQPCGSGAGLSVLPGHSHTWCRNIWEGRCPEQTSSPSSLPSPWTPHGSAVRTFLGMV